MAHRLAQAARDRRGNAAVVKGFAFELHVSFSIVTMTPIGRGGAIAPASDVVRRMVICIS